MDKISFALVLWSFLIGMVIGVFIGQYEAIRDMLNRMRTNMKKFNN